MIDLSTNYGSLKLNTPVIAGSSALTDNVDSLIELEKNGAGAVVLKSLFEEEIIREMENNLEAMSSSSSVFPETLEFFDYNDAPKESTADYLDLIKKAKTKLKIPVIASINCIDAEYWTYFPGQIEKAGADALELNIFILPADLNKPVNYYEQIYFKIIEEVQKQVNIPLFIKLSSYSTHLVNFLKKIADTKIDGIVLFNRFYNPDIDIDKLELCSGDVLSSESDIYQSLRWIGILAETVDCSLIASTGIHNYQGVVKQILAGASAVQIVSAIYKNGIPYMQTIIEDLKSWMQKKNFTSVNDFKGKLSQTNTQNPEVYSRIQFMKYFRGFSND
jgi:dihydroorotate dehydrogenase (fumarate)